MKWSSFVLTIVAAPALALSWPVAARAQEASTPCVNDIDCTAGGTACGTDVCNWNMGKICVPAASATMEDNWCGGDYSTTYDQATADMECKCHAQGATCVNFHCTIWTVDAGSSGASGASAADSGGPSGTAASGSATSDASTGGGSSGGGSSGGCSIAWPSEPPSAAFAALGFASGIVLARRRKRS